MARDIIVLAHRTGMAHAPENSLEGLDRCMDANVGGIECDVTFVGGEPFVWASDTAPGPPELRLRDLYRHIRERPGGTVYLDVKFYGTHVAGHFRTIGGGFLDQASAQIIRPALAMGIADRIGLVTFCGGAPLMRLAKQLDPRIATDLMLVFPWTDPAEYAPFTDAVTIAWDPALGNQWRLFPRSLRRNIARARAAGVQVRGGLANTAADIDWLISQDVDAIWTDDVHLAARHLASLA